MLAPILLALLGTTTIAASQDILLPAPPGPFSVVVRTSELIDRSRNESTPDAPTDQPRRMMISMFSPVARTVTSCGSADLLPKVAQIEHNYWENEAEDEPEWRFSADFNRFKLSACSVDVTHGIPTDMTAHSEDNYPTNASFPLVVFDPGAGTSRFDYNVLAQWFAATGFFVMTIDHPYSAQAIQWPDGSFSTYGRNFPVSWGFPKVIKAMEVRVGDVRFIADQLQNNKTFKNVIFPRGSRPALDKFGIWGHSFGGAVAAQTVYEDTRFQGGIDLDGQLFGTVVNKGLKKPFVLWLEQDLTRNLSSSWVSFWGNSTGFKRTMNLEGTTHFTFGDGKLQADVYPFNKAAFGTIKGIRAIQILSIYARDFFRFVFQSAKGPGLMQGPNKSYPEVTFES